jgi:chromosome segregation ATPase
MKRLGAVLMVAIIGIPAAVMLSAQARDGDSPVSRELVNEVRALRAVIERYADTQIQTQAITGLMDVQQRRLADVNARLDALRREVGQASQEVNRLTQELTSAERLSENAFVKNGISLDDSRREVEGVRNHARNQVEINTTHLQSLQTRESEMLNQLAAEEGKWNELVGRLDQWLRR